MAFFGSITDWSAFLWVLLGMALYLPIYLLLRNELIRIVGVMEHELCHFVAKYMFLGIVSEIRATNKEGGVTRGEPSNALTLLAPYFLPVLTLPLLGIRLLVTAKGLPIIDLLIGITLGLHYFRTLDNLMVDQKDFRDAGLLPTLTIPPTANMVFWVIIAAGVRGDYQAVPDYFRTAIAAAPANYEWAWGLLQKAMAQASSLIP